MASVVSTGMTSKIPKNLGAIRYQWELMPITSKASISSRLRMTANCEAISVPAFAATIEAAQRSAALSSRITPAVGVIEDLLHGLTGGDVASAQIIFILVYVANLAAVAARAARITWRYTVHVLREMVTRQYAR